MMIMMICWFANHIFNELCSFRPGTVNMFRKMVGLPLRVIAESHRVRGRKMTNHTYIVIVTVFKTIQRKVPFQILLTIIYFHIMLSDAYFIFLSMMMIRRRRIDYMNLELTTPNSGN